MTRGLPEVLSTPLPETSGLLKKPQRALNTSVLSPHRRAELRAMKSIRGLPVVVLGSHCRLSLKSVAGVRRRRRH